MFFAGPWASASLANRRIVALPGWPARVRVGGVVSLGVKVSVPLTSLPLVSATFVTLSVYDVPADSVWQAWAQDRLRVTVFLSAEAAPVPRKSSPPPPRSV